MNKALLKKDQKWAFEISKYQKDVYGCYLKVKTSEYTMTDGLVNINKFENYMNGYLSALWDNSIIEPDEYIERLARIKNMAFLYRSSILSYCSQERED